MCNKQYAIGDSIRYREVVEYKTGSTRSEIFDGKILEISIDANRVFVDNPSMEDARGTWVPARNILESLQA